VFISWVVLPPRMALEDPDDEDEALRKALARVAELRDRADADGTTPEKEAVIEAILLLFREHGAALSRRGLDVEGMIRDIETQRSSVQKAREKRDEILEALRRLQAGPYGDVPYHR